MHTHTHTHMHMHMHTHTHMHMHMHAHSHMRLVRAWNIQRAISGRNQKRVLDARLTMCTHAAVRSA